jgi:hypothetical protein
MQPYIDSAVKQFRTYKALGEKAIAQMTDEQLLWQANMDSNSVATIVQHLSGNMLSRWTDFLTTDGEKPWRARDAEFAAQELTREDMMTIWNKGWDCLFTALLALSDADLGRTIYIRGEAHTGLEAINRQIAHYAYHVGQIVYIAKLSSTSWASLSIPRNKSSEFNQQMFGK